MEPTIHIERMEFKPAGMFYNPMMIVAALALIWITGWPITIVGSYFVIFLIIPAIMVRRCNGYLAELFELYNPKDLTPFIDRAALILELFNQDNPKAVPLRNFITGARNAAIAERARKIKKAEQRQRRVKKSKSLPLVPDPVETPATAQVNANFQQHLHLTKVTSQLNKAINSADCFKVYQRLQAAAVALYESNDVQNEELQRDRRRIVGAIGKAITVMIKCPLIQMERFTIELYNDYKHLTN